MLTLAWGDPEAIGVPVGDGQTLFTVAFTVVGGPGSGSAIRITDRPTFGELSVRGRAVPFNTAEGLVAVRRADSGDLGTVQSASGQLGLWFEMPEEGKWVLEFSEDLRNWVPITDPAATSGGGLTQVMVPDPGGNNRFYRVIVTE